VACNNPPDGPSAPPTFTISPSRQWSGGTILITSQEVLDFPPTITVLFDSVPVAATRLDDSTVQVRLPIGRSEDLTVTIGDHLAGFISRVGYRDMRTLLGGAPFSIVSFPEGPVGIGAQWTGELGMWGLLTGHFSPLIGLRDYGGFALGPSFRGPTYGTGMDKTGVVVEWQLWPVVRPVDTVPGIPARVAVVTGPDDYVFGYSNSTRTVVNGVDRSFEGEEATRGFLSAAAGRALLDGGAVHGVPVFDALTGYSAYHLPLRRVSGAVFTRDGARLYLVGRSDPSTYNRLLAVDAATGAIISQDSLPASTEGYDLTLDLSESLLILAADTGGETQVLIYDALTLARLGTLSLPAGAQSCCFSARVAVDESTRSIFLTLAGDPLQVHGFDLLR
jgi:hypothetical protein